MSYWYNKEIETMPLERLRNLQDERLREQVAYVYERIPFYKQLLDEHSVRISDVRGVADLHLLPFTKKHHLRDNYPFGLLAMPVEEMSRIHCSSGTTGKPTVVAYTAGDIDIFSETMARSLAAGGCRPGMMMQNAYGYGLFTGGLGFHYGAEKLGMTVIPVSGGVTDRQLLLLQDFKAEVLACTPSYAQTLAQEMAKRNIPLSNIALKHAILGAEPWTEIVRAEVEAGLGLSATNMYGLSEIMGPGVSCEDCHEKGSGSYVWEDHYYPEVVDKDTGEPLPHGEYGVLVFTTLTKKGMPLLRYWTNDITNIYYDKAGRRTHIKMGTIRGRADDMLIIRGVNLFHTQVEDVLKDIHGLSANYRLVVSRKGTMDSVEVQVEVSEHLYHELQLQGLNEDVVAGSEHLSRLKHTLGKKIKDNIGLSMDISLVALDEMPRSEGGKLSRILDLRK